MLKYQVCGPVAGPENGSMARLDPAADTLCIGFSVPDGTVVHLRAASGAEERGRVKGGFLTVSRRLFEVEGDTVSVTLYPVGGEAIRAVPLSVSGGVVTALPISTAARLSDLWRALMDLQRRLGNVQEDCEELSERMDGAVPRLDRLWERAEDGDILL